MQCTPDREDALHTKVCAAPVPGRNRVKYGSQFKVENALHLKDVLLSYTIDDTIKMSFGFYHKEGSKSGSTRSAPRKRFIRWNKR